VTDFKKFLLLAVLISGFISSGCATNRIEGNEIPEQPPTNDVTVPAQAEAPPAPPAPPAATTPEAPPAPPEEAAAPPTEAPTAPPAPPAENPCNNYIVVKGDTLWGIAGSNSGYNDYFQWPLIFRANRDQITDPDLIYPKQEFCIKQDFTDQDKQKARKDASDTPKYVPHTKPRETLPVDYF
jgi:nucleoid-associated protein YgaU